MRRALIPSLVALFALSLPAATYAKASKYPVVKSFSPARVEVGAKLTIRGKGFVAGKKKNTVVWLAKNGPAIFTPADRATRTKITLIVPQKLAPHLKLKGGLPVATRFRIRVLGKRFGKAYTSSKNSPIVVPTGQGGAGSTDCDRDGTDNSAESDDDNDLIGDGREKEIGTDPCLADTDGDGVEDGYEQESALDLNSRALPYPGKRPYPNALDPSDVAADHDGDGMSLAEESAMWARFGGHTLPLNYSDGAQFTGNSLLSDDDKDVDGDGLRNWDERHGRMTQGWWDAAIKELPTPPGCYSAETRYPLTFAPVDYLDADTDGDGLKDGADDQDHDGLSNAFEVQRPANWLFTYVSSCHTPALVVTLDDPTTGLKAVPNPLARVQPFNPCKPHDTVYCHRHPDFGYYPKDEDWFSPAP